MTVMNINRIAAIVLRQFYLIGESLSCIADVCVDRH